MYFNDHNIKIKKKFLQKEIHCIQPELEYGRDDVNIEVGFYIIMFLI